MKPNKLSLTLPKEGVDLRKFIQTIEDAFTMQALERSKGNRTKAAKLLGLTRTCLLHRMKKFDLEQIGKEKHHVDSLSGL